MEKMTSVLTDDDRRGTRMKPKSSNQKVTNDNNTATNVMRDETRSFLNFSRENLNISHSELEQGFNKPSRCLRPSRHSILSIVAIFIALVCTGIEIWKLHRVISNTRDIDVIKRDVETLRHRLFGEDFMDELKAFEEQLYADGSEGDEDSGEADIESADYDNNYDEDYSPSWNDYLPDSRLPTTATTPSLVDVQSSRISLKNEELNDTNSSSSNRESVEMLAVLRKIEANRGQEPEKKGIINETRQNISRERLFDEKRESYRGQIKRIMEKQRFKNKEDHTKQRRAITEEIPIGYTNVGLPIFARTYSQDDRNNRTRNENGVNDGSDDSRRIKKKKKNGNKISTTEATLWERHPPKKYFASTRLDNTDDFSNSRHATQRQSLSLSRRRELRRLHQASELTRSSMKPRLMVRRNLRVPRQVFAAHYGADSALFGIEDEHTGNGRAKHNEGIFKAWRASDWVTDLGMSRHFTLSRDGRLQVHEPGLYLVYGQIHYLDEHDENGFHILVNGQPLLQCMVYSPGTGHKSRSCFSAQITVLQAGDRLVLKDVGPARYTLFQHDKSFFGLVKLGDSRQQQQQQQQSKHTTQTPETRR